MVLLLAANDAVVLLACPRCGLTRETARPLTIDPCTRSSKEALPRLLSRRSPGGHHAADWVVLAIDHGSGDASLPDPKGGALSLACRRGNHLSKCSLAECPCGCHTPTLTALVRAAQAKLARDTCEQGSGPAETSHEGQNLAPTCETRDFGGRKMRPETTTRPPEGPHGGAAIGNPSAAQGRTHRFS